MKKMIAAMAVAALALSFAACRSAGEGQSSADPQGSTAATQAATKAPTESEVQQAFKQIVLVDNDDAAVKITGIEEDSAPSIGLKVFLENKTDKELMFTADSVIINGFEYDTHWTETVDAGTKSDISISWHADDLGANGITTVDDLSFTLRIHESNDVLASEIFADTFTFHLRG